MSYWPGNTRNISSIFSCKSWKTTLLSSFLHWAESNILCHEVGDRKQESRSFRLGAFPWDFLVSWLNIQEGKHGDEVIEASKTFSGWSCCCASLAAECEPWSPQRVGGETQFHEVVLTGHTTMHVFAWNFTDGIEMTWIVSVLVPIPCLLLLRFVTGRTVCIVFYRYMHSLTRPVRFYYNTQRIGLSIYILQCQRN